METSVDPVTDAETVTDTPISEKLLTLYRLFSIPFHVWKRIQICLISSILLSYFLFAFLSAVWPREDHTPVSSRCGQNFSQWSVDLTSVKVENGVRVKNKIAYSENSTWIYDMLSRKYVRGCPCKVKKCLRKCCSANKVYVSPDHLVCTEGQTSSVFENLNGMIHSDLKPGQTFKDLRPVKVDEADYHVISGFADCAKSLGVLGARYEVQKVNSVLTEQGTVLMEDLSLLDIDDYCMEKTVTTGTILTVRCVKVSFLHELRSWLLMPLSTLQWAVLILSLLSLLATVAITIILSQLQDLHSKITLGFLACLTVYHLQFLVDFRRVPDKMEFVWQFSYISGFCWLTALCFDIWHFFCGPLQVRTERQERARLLVYGIFCCGVPLVLCVVSVLAGITPNHSDSCPKPRFLQDSCTFTVERGTRLFFNLPVVTLLVVNVLLFLSVLYNRKRQETLGSRVVSPCNRARELATQGFQLYKKLALIVVVSGSSLLLLTAPSSGQYSELLAILYLGQGLWIFLIICCNSRTLKFLLLKRRGMKNKVEARVDDDHSLATL